MSENGKTDIMLIYDKPNMDGVLESFGYARLDHYKFFQYFVEKGKFLYIYFFWRSVYNESSQSYAVYLNQLKNDLLVNGIIFEDIATIDKDVDIAILNQLMARLILIGYKPYKIILCSGDKDFSVILQIAKRIFGIQITVVNSRDCCAEILQKISKTIFFEDIVKNNENLLLDSYNPIK